MGEELFTDDPLDCAFIEMEQPDGWQQGAASPELLSHRGRMRSAGVALPLEDKIAHALKVLRSAFDRHDRWRVSYSGGKDSTVVSHLAVQNGFLCPHAYADTRLEYPETRRQVNRWRQYLGQRGVVLLRARSKLKPLDVWSDGLPIGSKMIASKLRQYLATGNEAHLRRVPKRWHEGARKLRKIGIKISEKCCDILKKNPMRELDKKYGFLGAITGVRATESEARKLSWLQRGSLYHSNRNGMWMCHPLAYWTYEDTVEYLRRNDIEVLRPPLRGSGCMACGFGCHLDTRAGRHSQLDWLRLHYRKMHRALVQDTGMEEAIDILEGE